MRLVLLVVVAGVLVLVLALGRDRAARLPAVPAAGRSSCSTQHMPRTHHTAHKGHHQVVERSTRPIAPMRLWGILRLQLQGRLASSVWRCKASRRSYFDSDVRWSNCRGRVLGRIHRHLHHRSLDERRRRSHRCRIPCAVVEGSL